MGGGSGDDVGGGTRGTRRSVALEAAEKRGKLTDPPSPLSGVTVTAPARHNPETNEAAVNAPHKMEEAAKRKVMLIPPTSYISSTSNRRRQSACVVERSRRTTNRQLGTHS
jgi:hypothetical protein